MGKKLKVLQIVNMYPTIEKPHFGIFVKTQIDSLRKLVDIELLVLPGGNGMLNYLRSLPVIIKKLKNDYDILHIHYGNVSSLIKLLRKKKKVPIVTSYGGSDLLGQNKNSSNYTSKNLIFSKINKHYAKYDSCSIVKTQELANEIQESAKLISIIPNGVDTTIFNKLNKLECRKKIGLDVKGNKKVILFPSDTKRAEKNYSLLKNALDKLNKDRYILLTFEGHKVQHDDVPLYLNAADLIVFTSLSEGSPNVVKEAMACNCRIFSTPCGDVEWLLDRVSGSEVLPYQVEVWCNKLEKFLTAEEGDLISDSRESLLKKGLDLDDVAKKVVKIYEDLANKNQKDHNDINRV